MPIWYLAFWENLFATIFCIPIMFIPIKSNEPWKDFLEATECLVGIPEETCRWVWVRVLVFIVVGTLWVSLHFFCNFFFSRGLFIETRGWVTPSCLLSPYILSTASCPLSPRLPPLPSSLTIPSCPPL
jgi:hypothetical protein